MTHTRQYLKFMKKKQQFIFYGTPIKVFQNVNCYWCNFDISPNCSRLEYDMGLANPVFSRRLFP